MKAYKVFDPNWKCIDFQYEVGKTYTHKGKIELCGAGFHACEKLVNCFNYYSFNSSNKVAEVELLGNVKGDEVKKVTNKIKIVKELSWYEVLELCNFGDCNTGYRNTGNRNTGYRNTGNRNTGNRNTGNWNTGDRNIGNRNTGYRNTGNWNTGDGNTGNWNTGNWNTGDRNTGDGNFTDNSAGSFCSKEQTVKTFDINSKMTISELRKCEGYWELIENLQSNEIFDYTQYSSIPNATPIRIKKLHESLIQHRKDNAKD